MNDAEGAIYISAALFYVMTYSESVRFKSSRLGIKVDIPRFIYSPPIENEDGIMFQRGALFSIGCYIGSTVNGAYQISIQPLISQGIPMLVNERMSLRGSPIIHTMFKNQGELAELYLIPGKRGAYGIVMTLQFADLYGEKKDAQRAMLSIFSMHLALLKDSFAEIDMVDTSRFGGGVHYGGYGEREMGWGTEQILKNRAETGIDPYEL
jgi:hypothetical protein